MKFHYGPIPEDGSFQPEAQGWSGIREPNPLLLNILGIPTSFLLLALTMYVVSVTWAGGFFALMEAVLEQSTWNPFLVSVVMLVLSIPLHELVHALVHPKFGRSNRSIFGLWLSRGLFYAHYDGEISRNRFLAILAAPYLVLGWAPVIVLALTGTWLPIEFALILVMTAIINSAIPAGDMLGILLLVTQIPTSACVKNKGWKSYWIAGTQCGA